MIYPPPSYFGLPSTFKEWRVGQLEAIHNSIASKKRIVVQNAPTGCHSKGTYILLFDGTLKKVEDVAIGDLLMGPDSLPREVLQLHQGIDTLFKIIPIKGEPFIVNKGHIFSLYRTRQGYTWKSGESAIENVPLTTLMSRSKWFRHIRKLWFSPPISFTIEDNLPIDPYFLGVLLGDGTIHRAIGVTTIDPEIINELERQAKLWNLKIRIAAKATTKACTYFLSGRKGKLNPVMEAVRAVGLDTSCGGKFVPKVYLTASIKNRLELLAGLIDTDGFYTQGSYEIITKSVKLKDSILFLARSLGFGVTISNKYAHKICSTRYFRLSIFGDIAIIPVKLPRKKAKIRKQKKNSRVTGFSLASIGEGKYYGFSVDKDNLYLTGDFLVHHNSGKSLIVMGEAISIPGRSLILTSTKPLQDLYNGSFNKIVWDVRGQQNYPCLALEPGGEHHAPYVQGRTTVAEGPCHFGEGCSLLLSGCQYYDRVRAAGYKKIVLTNYDLTLSMNRYTEGLGMFDFLACDEAHEVPEKLSSAMSAEVTEWEAKNLLRTSLGLSDDPIYWAEWAFSQCQKVIRTMELYKASGPEFYPKLRALSNIKRTLDQMSQADESWIVEVSKDRVHVEPIWPKKFVEPYLLNFARKVGFYSATIRPKTLGLLGLEDFDFFEYPSPFPLESRPIWYVPRVQMKYGMSYEDEQKWVRTVDQIIAKRLDRKIVIHTVSYARQKFLLAHSQFRRYMLANTKENTKEVLEAFKVTPAPCVLVSPSADTGVDFPGVECETIIIIKIPYTDISSKIYKARAEEDSEYGPYVAVQTLIQMAGRGMRSVDDRCEIIVTDSVFSRLLRDYSHLFPNWFLAAVRRSDTLPDPLEKL